MANKPKFDVYVSVPDKRMGNMQSPDMSNYRKKDCAHLKSEIKTVENLLKRWETNKASVTAQAKKSLEEDLKSKRVRLAGIEAEIKAEV